LTAVTNSATLKRTARAKQFTGAHCNLRRHHMSTLRTLLHILSIVVIVPLMLTAVHVPGASAQVKDGIKRQINAQTGKVSLLGPETGRLVPAAKALGLSPSFRPADPAMALAKRFGPEFGLRNAERDLKVIKNKRQADGRTTVRYQQSYRGIPVMGGELMVNTNEHGDLYSINGEVSPDLSLQTQPTIDSDEARQTALEGVAKWYQKAPEDFLASNPELWIYDESLLRPSTRAPQLIWRLEVTPKEPGLPIRELILVDAERGTISLHFNQVDTAWGEPRRENRLSVLNTAQQNKEESDNFTATHSTAEDTPALAGMTWYVATTGSDANSCSSSTSPCLTINVAIGKATAGDIVRIGVGTYTGTGPEVVLINKSITLSGGWNPGFTAQSGHSILDAQSARRGITVMNTITAIIDQSIVQNGKVLQGGGIYINSGSTVTLNNSAVRNNIAVWGGGAGIYVNSSSTVTLNNSTVTRNDGTGIANYGTLTLNNSTISSSTNSGIFNSGGTLILNNSTISGNTGTGSGGGGILNESGSTTLSNSTISANTTTFGPGGGIYNLGGPVNLKNTIIAGNSAKTGGQDCAGTISSSGYNLIGSISSCTFSPTIGDLTNVNAKLGELIGWSGYHPLQIGSPAIDAGNPATPGTGGNACLANDGRGITRPVGARCDIGAYEYTVPGSLASLSILSGDGQRAAPNRAFPNPLKLAALDNQGSPVPNVSVTFTAPSSGASGTFADTGTRTTPVTTNANGVAVTSTFTANSLVGSYAVVASASGSGSVSFNLQNVVWYVATTGSNTNNCQTPATACATINGALGKTGFIAGDTVLVGDGTYTGPGLQQVVLLDKNVSLSGGWNATFTSQNGWSTVDGQNARTPILVADVISATMDRFVIQNGSGYYGGGISNEGMLVLNNSLVRNNTCWGSSCGGGIGNGDRLTLNNSTVTGNTSPSSGGGIFNDTFGLLTLNNTTISGNSAKYGGGLYSYGTMVLNNTTISGNLVTYHGGGVYFYGEPYGNSFTIRNTLVAGNSAGSGAPDCSGMITSSGYNLIGNTDGCSFISTTGDVIGTNSTQINARITLLQDNGGLTFTHALMAGSPAIDAGNPAAPGSGGNACLATDQRGTGRPIGARCDIGAYEGSVVWTPTPVVNTFTADDTSSLPGTLLCNQYQPNCTNGKDTHADAAHKYAIGTYNLYANQHGRDSLDNNGMVIVSTVNYCDPDYGCPYDGAYWSSTQIVYGNAHDDPLADDVVAHEFTHGVTQYESNLFYYYQSGAINESLSDIWGEYYDQTNGQATDTSSVKWQIGEDSAPLGTGAFRSMSDPTIFGDPDMVSSLNYYTGEADNGGVHFNSGINNKAAFLMVNGGGFNSKTVTALGWAKTTTIYYEANTNVLTSGADYSDLYYALQQACSNLIGQKGITSEDCNEVKDAIDAVEMNTEPRPTFNSDAPYCKPSISATPVFSDDLESGTGNWTFTNGVYPRWQLDSAFYGPYAHSGLHSLYADDYPDVVTDATAQLDAFNVPTNAFLHFSHAYEFETDLPDYYDGGVLEYSINGGATWLDAEAFIEYNEYGGTIFTGAGNPLSGRRAFVGSSHGYLSTRLNLASLIGKSVTFRWRMGLDQFMDAGGWWLDDVKMYQCIPNPVETGTYDDTSSAWQYTGNWTTANATGPYNSTDRYSNDPNATASITFNGGSFNFKYVKYSNRGNIEVWIDGVKVDTINAFSANLEWQSTYTKSGLGSGAHTAVFKHAGPSGTYIDVDSIQIISPDLVPPGNVTGLTAATGTINGSVSLSWIAPADDAGNNASGPVAGYLVKYSTSPFGSWNDGTLITTGLPTPVAPGATQTMTVSGLNPGTLYHFAVRAQDEQPNLSASYATASATAKLPTPMGLGTYDDTDPAWAYSGNWNAANATGPYNSTDHYSNDASANASFTFTGTGFHFKYLKYSNRGNIEVWLDGAKVDTVSANNTALGWQSVYSKTGLSNSTHTVVFRHGGPAGSYIDVDSITITGPVGLGTYDDNDPAWAYTGNWTAINAAGPFGGTDHYSNDATAMATITFNGTAFVFKYLTYSNRGNIEVWLDGVKVDTINANSTSLGWQNTYTRAGLSAGTHTVIFKHGGPSSSYIDIDSIQILVPAEVGPYDDPHSAWSYSGNWTAVTAAGPSNGTDRFTNDPAATASFTFNGSNLAFKYLKYFNRGNIDVWIDGIEADTINANSPTLAWQSTYTKTGLPAGAHTVTFKHGGPAGSYIDIDSIQVLAPDLLPPGNVTGLNASTGTTNGSVNLSWTAPADDAGNNTSGPVAGYLVKYSTSPFTSWSNGTLIATGLPTPTAPGTTQTMTVSGLNPGTLYYFAVRAQDEQPNLSASYAIASAAARLPAPMGVGLYDDTDPAWTYTGNWAAVNATGPYNGTDRYSNDPAATASFTFTGTAFAFKYLLYSNRGNIEVWLDGAKVDTLNANNQTLGWQTTYTKGGLSNGNHTVIFKHGGPADSYIDIDSIQILVPAGSGTYDDTDPAWSYSGDWTPAPTAGPDNDTDRYSNDSAATATFTFNGNAFVFKYLLYSNRGNIEVWLDGVKVETINANSPTLAWQSTYTKSALPMGIHTVVFKHGGPVGSYIDIDSIQILP
jgi:Zn-dependent metalloprotease